MTDDEREELIALEAELAAETARGAGTDNARLVAIFALLTGLVLMPAGCALRHSEVGALPLGMAVVAAIYLWTVRSNASERSARIENLRRLIASIRERSAKRST